jgi:hypothetical protein
MIDDSNRKILVNMKNWQRGPHPNIQDVCVKHADWPTNVWSIESEQLESVVYAI